MEILKVDIENIKPYSRNPRKNEKAVKEVMKSIEKVGYRTPVVVDENMEILVGHTRWKAMKELGHKTLNIIQYKDLTKEQKDDYRILDNKTGEVAEWDFDILLEDFDKDHLLDLGFDIKDLPMDEVVEDEAPPVPEIPKTVKGDLYELGNHRLLCGDSTIITDVEKLMDGQKADMVFTDPPYGIGMDGQKKSIAKNTKHNRKEHENRGWDKTRPSEEIFSYILSLNIPSAIFGGNYFTDYLVPSRGWIYWDKGQEGLTMSDGELCWTNLKKPLRSVVVNRAKLKGSVHPTQKPIEVVTYCFNYLSVNDGIVFDPFSGSGSTLIACEQTNRKCYGIELDEKYCDVIVQRYVNFTKNTKIKLNGKEIEWPINSESTAKNA